ncbi:hypothetical protein EI94DRAFT_1151486 [Lactarius quietus]|nr:hypothetical protein EI94DRAFT_1151486 [Lactarius quietus]
MPPRVDAQDAGRGRGGGDRGGFRGGPGDRGGFRSGGRGRGPGYGNAGTPIRLISNHVAVQLTEGMVYQYDVILPDKDRPVEWNHQIIRALQTQVEPLLSTQPGVYDGKKNLYTTCDLQFENGAQEYVVPIPPSPGEAGRERQDPTYRVRLTLVQSINPEVLQRYVDGEQSRDNSVSTALMALNVATRMAPNQRYPHNARPFFH